MKINTRYVPRIFTCYIILLFIALFLMIGCEKYQEGDQAAKEVFSKMTIQEKSLYDAVENAWNADLLLNVRNAVNNREVKPLENAIPFIDIANVIKSNNDITLKIIDSWNTDSKNKAINGRWDRIDNSWYTKIINKLGLKEADIVKQPLIIEPVKPNVEITVTHTSNNDSSDEASSDEAIKKQEEYFETKDDIIPLREYDDLYFELKDCPVAIDKYSQIIEERLITIEDKNLLLKMATKCKAITIKEKLKLWKTTK